MNEADDIGATSEVGVVSPGYTSDAWGLGSADMQQDPESFAVSAPQSETLPEAPSDESIESSEETSGPSRVADVLWHLTVFDVQLAHLKRQFDNSERSYASVVKRWQRSTADTPVRDESRDSRRSLRLGEYRPLPRYQLSGASPRPPGSLVSGAPMPHATRAPELGSGRARRAPAGTARGIEPPRVTAAGFGAASPV